RPRRRPSGDRIRAGQLMRVLALVYGSARCGCALSDATGTIATPLALVPRPGSRRGLRAIGELVHERGVELVLVGLPLGLDGGDTEQTREAREFARTLAARLGEVPVEMYDERFTTKLAERGTPGGSADEDSRAAAHLLEGWLARRSR